MAQTKSYYSSYKKVESIAAGKYKKFQADDKTGNVADDAIQ